MEAAMAERQEDEQMQDNRARELSSSENGDLVEKLGALVKDDGADFSAWTSLISEIEDSSVNDMESICKVYDAFLLEFPLCLGYWKKYASHVAHYCDLNKAEKVYERAVEAMPYSVDLWVSYCSFGLLAYEDTADVRRLFERGLSFVGKDYSSYLLWDKYIEFEYAQKQWYRLACIYIKALRFPTKKLINYYMSFKKLVAIWEEETGCDKSAKTENGSCENTNGNTCKQGELRNVISNLLDLQDGLPTPSLVKKYSSVGELLYEKASQIDEKINSYEAGIQRPYFHMKPLDDCQLKNWHRYLDFVEMQGDFDWTVKLYERCLIPCANYSEFWIRYVEFAEAKGGREIANHALRRAQKLFLKRVPAFHLYISMFKEKIGDIDDARALFRRLDVELDPEFIENVSREANMEKRMGNTESARMVYEKAIEMAKSKQNLQILKIIYEKFARFTFAVTNDIDAVIEVFLRGIREVLCKSIIQEMISFITLHGSPGQIPKLDVIISNIVASTSPVSQALNSHDREEISNLFLEFVDLYGNIHEVRKAWDRHRKLFPHIMEPSANYRGAPFRDNLFAKEVGGRMQRFIPGSQQASGNDGHDGSGMHLLDSQPFEDNNHIPSEGRTAGELQDVINDNDERQELDGVAKGVEKHPINDSKGREVLMGVPEEAGKYSINDMESEEGVKSAEDVEEHSINAHKEGEEGAEAAEDVEMQLIREGAELHEDARLSAHESQDEVQVREASPECLKVENHVQSSSVKESDDGFRRLSPKNPSIMDADNETHQSNPAASRDLNTTQEATSGAGENVLLNEGNSDEVSAIHVSDPKDDKLSSPSQVHGNNSPLHSVCESTPPESRSDPQVQMQANAQTVLPEDLPANAACSQNANATGTWPQMYYIQSSQSQQWHGHLQLNPAVSTNPQVVVAQGYPYQSQSWSGTGDPQQVNQNFGQYQMATSQVYPVGTLTWPGQNVQQQAYAYVQPQSGTQPQTQVNQQSLQSNEQQYGYIQNNQGLPHHIWQYYQQQYYYLQQQQQQNQQIQGNSLQEQKIDQLQQSQPHQQPQLNQQMPSQQQQQIPNQQRSSQQNQQLHDQQRSSQLEQQWQHNQQSVQQLQQHQLAQYMQQNQQVQSTQHYQQLLYMQQQQQQQLYLQQQQQYYLQQQQLLQQQQFQQLSQQEQQLLLQQQQQLLQQQQHQQSLQLQQQQQQQLQQLQQQSVRQHQLNHQPVQQPQQQQQQTGGSGPKALSSNYSQRSHHVQQHSSNPDGPEHSGQAVTSQGEGDELQNVEQSAPSISHPQTPSNR